VSDIVWFMADGVRGVRWKRKRHDPAKRCATIERQQLGAMLALVTDEQQALLFGGRDVPVNTAEFGLCVNDHGSSHQGRGNTHTTRDRHPRAGFAPIVRRRRWHIGRSITKLSYGQRRAPWENRVRRRG